MDDSEASHGSRPEPQLSTGGAPADRLSSLSDDLLLQVLSHLGYASDAARTILLCRRWRRLYSHLPELDVTLRDVPLGSLEDALRRAARPGVRLLDIAVPVQDRPTTVSKKRSFWPVQEAKDPCGTISSLLREAARLSPAQLRFTVPPDLPISPLDRYVAVDLPRFHRAASIDLRVPPQLRLTHPRASTGFPALERLSISGCYIDLNALIPLCPRLRLLTVAADAPGAADFTVQSFSLQGLVVDRSSIPTRLIVVQAPVLKRLTMSLSASRELSVSISVPIVEKRQPRDTDGGLVARIPTPEKTRARRSLNASMSYPCECVVTDSLCFPNKELEFAAEISKHMVTDFSALELRLTSRGHAFGSVVWRLLGTPYICHATRSLRIILLRTEASVACQPYCPCNGPFNWKIQKVFLQNLEKLEIEGFEGEDCEFEFLNLVLERARMLTRVTVRLPDQSTPDDDWCTKLHDIFAVYPSVEASIDLIRGKRV
ncbi:unnamed protein product [Alopecurus aequalis]